MFRSTDPSGADKRGGAGGAEKNSNGISLGLGSTKTTGVIGPIWGTCTSDLEIEVGSVRESKVG